MDCFSDSQFYSTPNSYEWQTNPMHSKIRAAHKIIIRSNVHTTNFFDLIDNNKLISIDVNAMNHILDSGCFTMSEKDYIRELRRKTMNRKTAKMSRIKDKKEYRDLSEDVDVLLTEKRALSREKEDLIKEINFYNKFSYNYSF